MKLSALLTCEEEAYEGGLILRLTGKADLLAVPKTRELLKDLLKRRPRTLIVDVSGVTFLNTPFWAAFQRFNLDGRPDSRLVIAGMREALQAAFDIHGLAQGPANSAGIQVFQKWEDARDVASQ